MLSKDNHFRSFSKLSESTFVLGLDCIAVSAIQNRPLPQPPQSDLSGHELHYWNVACDQTKTLGQVA
jgi:hypothetical protein